MKRITILLALLIILIVALPASAEKITAKKPDFAKIKSETQNPDSKYYFPKLMALYVSNDTVMDIEQYRYLYYGYTFQEDYNPYRKSEFSDIIEPLYFKAKHTSAECDTIMKYAELSLADNQFDLRQMTFFIIALKERKKAARASIWQYRLNHLVGAILSSGTGTKENPWYVISPAHEYNILNFIGLVATGHEALGEDIDYLKVKKKDSKSHDGYYFDVSKIIDVYNRKFNDKKAVE
ncbi:MAG: DUF4919 domain-containing protein [Muribaculaceae bacterium]